MKVAIRNAHLENDRDELIQFLHENLTKDSDTGRFDWLYLQNPCGEARAWMAIDSDSGHTIGVAAAFPRNFFVGGSERRVWVLGDFCISNQSRSLGPALQLQRGCLASLEGEFWYDFPSRSMMAVYKRLGIPAVGDVVRYARLLRVDGKIENMVSAKSLARAVSVAGNTLLRVRSRNRIPEGLELSVFSATFGDEFDALSGRMSRTDGIRGTRPAAFLNWRYRQRPNRTFMVIVAKRRSELQGYAVIAVQEPDAAVDDVQATDEKMLPVILGYASNLLLQRNVNTLSAPVLADPALLHCLKLAGFSPRERSPVVAKSSASFNWLLLACDRDS